MFTDEQRILLLCGLLVQKESALQQAVNLNEANWMQLLKIANQLWLGTTLAHQLATSSIWINLDDELQTYLDSLKEFSQFRNKELKSLAVQIQTLLNEHKIEAVWIKGGSALFNGIDTPTGKRWMMDLDVLVDDSQMEEVVNLLIDNGFNVDFDIKQAFRSASHHIPPIVSPDGKFGVEIHRNPLSFKSEKYLSSNEVFEGKIHLDMDSVWGWQINPTQQVIHALVHDQISHGHFNANAVHLRYMLHLCWLVTIFKDSIDFNKVADTISDLKLIEIVFYLCWKLFGLDTPLTKQHSLSGEKYWNMALQNQTDNKWSFKNGTIIERFRISYSPENLHLLYGNETPLWVAAIYNTFRLLRRRLTLKHWKKICKRTDHTARAGMMWIIYLNK